MARKKSDEDEKGPREGGEDDDYDAEADVCLHEAPIDTDNVKTAKILLRLMQYNGGDEKFMIVRKGQKGKAYSLKRIPLEHAAAIAHELTRIADGDREPPE